MLEGLVVPAYIVALATAAGIGAKAVMWIKAANGNGNGRGVFEGRVVTLLETQTREISELRNLSGQQKDILQQLVTLIAAHDAKATAAISKLTRT